MPTAQHGQALSRPCFAPNRSWAVARKLPPAMRVLNFAWKIMVSTTTFTSTPLTADYFLSSTLIIMDTHIAYTDGGYANLQNVIADLNYLGINQVRDGISDGENGSAPLSSYIALAEAGIKLLHHLQCDRHGDLNAMLGLINQVETAVPGSVLAIEAIEINNDPVTYAGVSGLQGALNEQAAIYSAVHSDTTLAGVRFIATRIWSRWSRRGS